MGAVRHSRTSIRRALALAALDPPLIVAVTVWRYGLDVPHMDQWELVPLLQAAAEGRLTLASLWASLWAPHNEHRLVAPRLIMLALARLTAWDVRYELATSLFLALGTWMLLAGLIRATVALSRRRSGPGSSSWPRSRRSR